MRAALSGLFLLILAAPAPAQVSESSIHAQLTAQGYENIEFTEVDGQLNLRAVRRKFVLESVYDIATGALLSERVTRLPEGPAASETAIAPAPGPTLVDTSTKDPTISAQTAGTILEVEEKPVNTEPVAQADENVPDEAPSVKAPQTSSANEVAADEPKN